MTKRVGEYELGTILGEGAFGIVRMATHTITKQIFAIKIIDKEKVKREELIESLKKEIQILMMIDHPNIVKLIEVLASKTKIYLILEWIRGGELFEVIRSQVILSEDKMRIYFRQIVRALLYCQSKSIAHRDLKPENILITSDDKIKVSDFGLSSLYKDPTNFNTMLYTTCGTINYLAPEVIQSTGYDGHKADIWSLGVMLYFACAGFLPFDDTNIALLLDKIVMAKYIPFPKHFSKSLKDLLTSILVTNAYKRISLDKIKHHAWFQENILATEVQELEDDKQLFKSTEQTNMQNSTLLDMNMDQSYHVVKTSDWKVEYLNELIIIRRMGAFEFLSFMTGKILNNLGHIKPKSKQIEELKYAPPIQQFTSKRSLDDVCRVVVQAFKELKPFSCQQQNEQKTLLLNFLYKQSKEQLVITCELFELHDELILIDVTHKEGSTTYFNKVYQQIFSTMKVLIS